MNVLRNVIVSGPEGKPITLDVFYEADGRKKPLVIFAHGFKGFKDWGHFDLIAGRFAEQGFVFLKFNFSHNGVTPDNLTEFADLEAFGRNTYMMEVDDIICVLDAVSESGAFLPDEEVDREDLTLIGHSKGGGQAILAADQDKRIRRLVTWASVCRFGRMFDDPVGLEKWKEEGVQYVYNGRTKQYMPMYYSFYESFRDNKDKLDIEAAARRLVIPWLIVHGTEDEAVPYAEGQQLHAWQPASTLLTIEGGGHTFGGRHPWESTILPEDSARVVEESIHYINNQ